MVFADFFAAISEFLETILGQLANLLEMFR